MEQEVYIHKAVVESVHPDTETAHVTFAGDGFAVVSTDLFIEEGFVPTLGATVILEENRAHRITKVLPLVDLEA